jgi:hypothetical protein
MLTSPCNSFLAPANAHAPSQIQSGLLFPFRTSLAFASELIVCGEYSNTARVRRLEPTTRLLIGAFAPVRMIAMHVQFE